MNLLIQLLLAHLLGDFFLQSNRWVEDKEQKKAASVFIYIHVIIHFFLILIITGTAEAVTTNNIHNFFFFWEEAAIISVLHYLIDLLKLYRQNPTTRRKWFFIDQALHLIVIVAVCIAGSYAFIDPETLISNRVLKIVTGLLFLMQPSSFIIRMVISRWSPEQQIREGDDLRISDEAHSLENAGELIGMLERILVFIFILVGRWEGVGFLLAAKSVFRFGDLKQAGERKLTEYVLIGTLVSFGMAILTGIVVTL